MPVNDHQPQTKQTPVQIDELLRQVRRLEKSRDAHLRAEQALIRQTAVLREQAELLDLAHDTIMVRDMADRILFWNLGAEETYGYSRAEALGQVTHTFLKTRFPRPLDEIEEEVLRLGRWEGELIHTTKDGRQIAVASRWALRRDEQGRPAAVLEINNDFSQRKEAEEALRRTLEELDERVRARTAELLAANQALTEEIYERRRMEESLRQSEQELTAKTEELKEVNSALQVLLKQQERYRADMEDQTLSNVRILILPYLENLLATRLSPEQRAQAEILESNLRNVVSRFTRRLSAANLGLTPKELLVANLIRDGKSTKEIAELMRISPRAVVFHRQNLRRKLGFKAGQRANLRSTLLSLA